MKIDKPIVETIINSIALALTSYGVVQITTNGLVWQGYIAIVFGIVLEWIKYYGRLKKTW